MEFINKYVLSVCFAIIFCVASELLTPSKKYRNIIRLVSGIFILYTIFVPVGSKLEFKLNFPQHLRLDSEKIEDNYSYYKKKTEEELDKAVYSSASKALETEIKCGLKQFDASDANVSAVITQDKTEVKISGIPKEKHAEVYNYIKKGFGAEPEITE